MGFAYKSVVRPLLFKLDSRTVHEYAEKAALWISRHDHLLEMMADHYSEDDERLRTKVFGLDFRNPVGLAAGYDKNGEMVDFLPALGFGYLNIGSVTAEANPGNPGKRAWRLPDDQAILNNYGLNSEGREKVSTRLEGKRRKVPTFINIAKTNDPRITGDAAIEDYLKSLGSLYRVADGIEVSVGCGNTADGRTFEDPRNLDRLLNRVKREKDLLACMGKKPIVVKLSPDNDYGRLNEIIDVCEDYDTDGYTIANASKRWTNLNTDKCTLDEIRKAGSFSLSGRPIREKTTRQVSHVYARTEGRKPIKGCGGIFSAEDALEKIFAGASLVEFFTGFPYEGHTLPREINRGILKYMERNGIEKMSDMVGMNSRI